MVYLGFVSMNFTSFQSHSHPKEMFENLLSLVTSGSDVSKLLEEIEKNLTEPNMSENFAKMFNASANQAEDDFKQMFDNTLTNILYFLWLILLMIISTPFEILLIYYEKFGGDPMKRSLRNQLFAQTGYIGVLWCIIPTAIWTYRMFIGPINPHVVEAYYFLSQGLSSW